MRADCDLCEEAAIPEGFIDHGLLRAYVRLPYGPFPAVSLASFYGRI